VAGLGSARIGLMNGEIHGGFMDQTFTDPSIAPLTTGVYGAHLPYYRTRSLSFTASHLCAPHNYPPLPSPPLSWRSRIEELSYLGDCIASIRTSGKISADALIKAPIKLESPGHGRCSAACINKLSA
jgi:hypothetical protein